MLDYRRHKRWVIKKTSYFFSCLTCYMKGKEPDFIDPKI